MRVIARIGVRVCTDMCMGMCVDVRVDICSDMCVDMCMPRFNNSTMGGPNVSLHMSIHTSKHMPACNSTHMSLHTSKHVPQHIFRHMPLHTSKHMSTEGLGAYVSLALDVDTWLAFDTLPRCGKRSR